MNEQEQAKQDAEKCKWCGVEKNSAYFLPLCKCPIDVPDNCMFKTEHQHLCRFFEPK